LAACGIFPKEKTSSQVRVETPSARQAGGMAESRAASAKPCWGGSG